MLSPEILKKVEEMRDELKAINKILKEMGKSEFDGGIFEKILKEVRDQVKELRKNTTI